jgi:hypothetical protein
MVGVVMMIGRILIPGVVVTPGAGGRELPHGDRYKSLYTSERTNSPFWVCMINW